MAIKSYNTKADYDAAVKSTIESQVSMIETTREIIVDGVNVVTTEPVTGDVVFLDDQNNIIFVKGGAWIQKANIPVAWTHVGYVYHREGRKVGIIHKDASDEKWLDVCQYAITAIAQTNITVKLWMAPSWAGTDVAVTLASTDINAANAQAISEAVAAKATEVGDTAAWWAYLADADGNKVTENGTQIIIQRDSCDDYRFYNVSGTGCTIAHISWGDMPARDIYWHGERGYYTNYWGVMNIAKTKAWATGSGRVPSSQEPITPRAGNDAPVRPSAFAESEFCADLRAAYKTYEEYLEKCYCVVYPQKYGCFALPDGEAMAKKYARKSAPTKEGGTKYMYPALYVGYAKSFGVDGLDFGDWHLPGVAEGTVLMKDATLEALAPSVQKMGTTAINNGTYRWFAARYNVNYAWLFSASYGSLYNYYVNVRNRTQAVALLNI